MKKAKIAAAVILSAAMCTAAVAVAGCSQPQPEPETEKFEISNYAHALDSAYAKKSGILDLAENNTYKTIGTFAEKTSWKDVTVLDNSSGFADVTNNDADVGNEKPATHTLYDLNKDKAVEAGNAQIEKKNLPSSYSPTYSYYELTKPTGEEADGSTTYKYIAPDGSVLGSGNIVVAAMGTKPEITSVASSVFVKGEKEDEVFSVYKFTEYHPTDENPSAKTEYYYALGKDDNGNIIWKKIDKDGYSQTPYVYEHGKNLGIYKYEVVDSEAYPDAELAGYHYTVEGNMYESYVYNCALTYYDGSDEKLGSVDILNGAVIGQMGNYVYYATITPVSSEATTGYNFVIDSYSQSKYDYKLFRYDFVNGAESSEELTTDYIVMPKRISRDSEAPLSDCYTSLYNYSADKFDKMTVSVCEKIDGVAYVNEYSTERTYLIDESGEVEMDLTNKSIDLANTYKLSDTRYLCGMNIYDENLAPISQVPEIASSASINVGVMPDSQRVVIYGGEYGGGMWMLASYDGTIDFCIMYGSNVPHAYNGSVAVDMGGGTFVIYSSAAPKGKTVDELLNKGEKDTVGNIGGKLLWKKTPVDGSEAPALYNYTIYDLTGKALKTFNNCTDSDIASKVTITEDMKVVVKVTVQDATTKESQLKVFVA